MFTKDEQRKALPSPLHGDSLQLSGTRLNQTNGKLLLPCRVLFLVWHLTYFDSTV